MKLHLAQNSGRYAFTGYGDDYVAINEVRHRASVIVTPTQVFPQWTEARFETLTLADFERLAALEAEVLLFGTGTSLRFPAPELLRPLIAQNRGLEVMSADFLPFTRPAIDEATIAAVGEVLRSGWITTGPKCAELETALSRYFGGRTVRVFSSGTITLEIALKLAGVGPGDEVITTPLSWVATANVILHVGARPVFVDVAPDTRNLDLDRLEAAITPRTKAIIPVDLAGLPVDRDRLYAIAQRHSLRVIEDAAQSMPNSMPPSGLMPRSTMLSGSSTSVNKVSKMHHTGCARSIKETAPFRSNRLYNALR